ncbi:hypothetical protein Patl1_14530 [Pistacia atlantica]|uniref:Uncharacterized protein n=1 Tax=Pistacia atlantica TaxID=434234 RepID=A0ACC1AUY0_9ROSI|nr:hypothetical protein Patl1_14530 [Pistacia atlantica]
MLRPQGNHTEKSIEKKDDWLKEMNNALMVVASLIATVTFQVGLNPPASVWQDTRKPSHLHHIYHMAGESITAYTYSLHFNLFFAFNTMAFVASLCIILLLVSGLPYCKRRLFTWILMVILWVAITAITFAYIFSLICIRGPN